jgi:hypothetical protein
LPFSASMEIGKNVCANLWMIVDKRREKQRFHRQKNESRARAGEAGGGSVNRIIEEMHADAGHAISTQGLNVRHSANEFAFKGRKGFDFLGNFQAKLKLDSFAELEARRKIRAAFGDVHGLRSK